MADDQDQRENVDDADEGLESLLEDVYAFYATGDFTRRVTIADAVARAGSAYLAGGLALEQLVRDFLFEEEEAQEALTAELGLVEAGGPDGSWAFDEVYEDMPARGRILIRLLQTARLKSDVRAAHAAEEAELAAAEEQAARDLDRFLGQL